MAPSRVQIFFRKVRGGSMVDNTSRLYTPLWRAYAVALATLVVAGASLFFGSGSNHLMIGAWLASLGALLLLEANSGPRRAILRQYGLTMVQKREIYRSIRQGRLPNDRRLVEPVRQLAERWQTPRNLGVILAGESIWAVALVAVMLANVFGDGGPVLVPAVLLLATAFLGYSSVVQVKVAICAQAAAEACRNL